MQQEKLQHLYCVTEEEYKMKTFQRVKVGHEIVQYIKRVQHEKSTAWKDYYTKKCNMEMVQYEKVQYEKI